MDSNIDEIGDNGSDFNMPIPFKESGDNNPETIKTIYDIDSFGGVYYENMSIYWVFVYSTVLCINCKSYA